MSTFMTRISTPGESTIDVLQHSIGVVVTSSKMADTLCTPESYYRLSYLSMSNVKVRRELKELNSSKFAIFLAKEMAGEKSDWKSNLLVSQSVLEVYFERSVTASGVKLSAQLHKLLLITLNLWFEKNKVLSDLGKPYGLVEHRDRLFPTYEDYREAFGVALLKDGLDALIQTEIPKIVKPDGKESKFNYNVLADVIKEKLITPLLDTLDLTADTMPRVDLGLQYCAAYAAGAKDINYVSYVGLIKAFETNVTFRQALLNSNLVQNSILNAFVVVKSDLGTLAIETRDSSLVKLALDLLFNLLPKTTYMLKRLPLSQISEVVHLRKTFDTYENKPDRVIMGYNFKASTIGLPMATPQSQSMGYTVYRKLDKKAEVSSFGDGIASLLGTDVEHNLVMRTDEVMLSSELQIWSNLDYSLVPLMAFAACESVEYIQTYSGEEYLGTKLKYKFIKHPSVSEKTILESGAVLTANYVETFSPMTVLLYCANEIEGQGSAYNTQTIDEYVGEYKFFDDNVVSVDIPILVNLMGVSIPLNVLMPGLYSDRGVVFINRIGRMRLQQSFQTLNFLMLTLKSRRKREIVAEAYLAELITVLKLPIFTLALASLNNQLSGISPKTDVLMLRFELRLMIFKLLLHLHLLIDMKDFDHTVNNVLANVSRSVASKMVESL